MRKLCILSEINKLYTYVYIRTTTAIADINHALAQLISMSLNILQPTSNIERYH